MSWESEREAREDAERILRQRGGERRSGVLDGDQDSYGAGRLDRSQRKSQERHIPMTPGPDTVGKKVWRNLFG